VNVVKKHALHNQLQALRKSSARSLHNAQSLHRYRAVGVTFVLEERLEAGWFMDWVRCRQQLHYCVRGCIHVSLQVEESD
jgi:hypothetical protein